MDYMSTDFGSDSSRRFSVRVHTQRQTDKQTQLNARSRLTSLHTSLGLRTMSFILSIAAFYAVH